MGLAREPFEKKSFCFPASESRAQSVIDCYCRFSHVYVGLFFGQAHLAIFNSPPRPLQPPPPHCLRRVAKVVSSWFFFFHFAFCIYLCHLCSWRGEACSLEAAGIDGKLEKPGRKNRKATGGDVSQGASDWDRKPNGFHLDNGSK